MNFTPLIPYTVTKSLSSVILDVAAVRTDVSGEIMKILNLESPVENCMYYFNNQ